jgi:hypothetical protein
VALGHAGVICLKASRGIPDGAFVAEYDTAPALVRMCRSALAGPRPKPFDFR